jgi:integrase/recombinase XerC
MSERSLPVSGASHVSVQSLVEAFLAGRNANTIRAYREGLRDFAAFLQVDSIEDAARALLASHPGEANALVLRYRTSLGVHSVATINSRLSAVRALVKLAKLLGVVAWSLEIPNLPHQAYRDTRGPGQEGVKAMLRVLQGRKTPKSYRDAAIIHLLFDRVLRRGEVAALNLADLDARDSRLRIRGKGQQEPEWLSLAPVTLRAIGNWLVFRGLEPGPLFFNLDRAMPQGRLSAHGIYLIVRQLGQQAVQRPVRPHGLRHAGITCALDRTNGNIRAVAQFARHKRVETTLIYDDARRDLGGAVSRLVSE